MSARLIERRNCHSILSPPGKFPERRPRQRIRRKSAIGRIREDNHRDVPARSKARRRQGISLVRRRAAASPPKIICVWGHLDKTFELLEHSFKRREARIAVINVEAEWNPIRSNERYSGLMGRSGYHLNCNWEK